MKSRKIDTLQKLYHGTRHYHTRINLNYSSSYKDFGRGYYLTSHLNQAVQWAEGKVNNEPCWVFEYALQIVPDTFQIKELLKYDREWLDFFIAHRVYGQKDHLDIVYDRMADNKFERLSAAVRSYANGGITAEAALGILRFQREDRDQFCFKTEASIALLKRTRTYTKHTDGKWYAIETEVGRL